MIAEAVCIGAIGLILWHVVGYPCLMLVMHTWSRAVPQDECDAVPYIPCVSVIVPTYNEATTIRDSLRNLLEQDYPWDRFEIVMVDSASTDGTVLQVEDFHQDGLIALLSQAERRGKGSAINCAVQECRGDILIVTDANCYFNRQAIRRLADHFKYSRVGAVSGRLVRLDEKGNPLWRELHSFEDHIEMLGESVLDSCATIYGEIGAFRRDLLVLDETQSAEDFDLAISIRRLGYVVEYEPDAIAFEQRPIRASDMITQRRRWAGGIILCLWKHRRYLWVPGDLFRLVIIPSHKGIRVIMPFLVAAAVGSFVWMILD
ncbi:MAG: glycosyltransferase [Dehalococcoidia bacterium]|nr:glycosyltransferase [Dehalococcoidia bacterium]